MKEYLLLFRNPGADNSYLVSSKDATKDMPKWESWIGNIAMQGKLVSTAPVEYNASRVSADGIKAGPHKELNNVLVSGYLICKSDNMQEVEEWSKTCPILQYPNSNVEIRPLIPFPMK